MLYSYNGSTTGGGDVPEYVNLNSDGKLVILETNDKYPVRIINTSTGLVVRNITLAHQIYCANFIDSTNRFLYMQTDIGDIFYDTVTSVVTYYTMNATLPMHETRIDFTKGLLHNLGTNYVRSFGTNITYNGTKVAGYYPPLDTPTNSPTNTTANTTNATANTTNATANITTTNTTIATETTDTTTKINDTSALLPSDIILNNFTKSLNVIPGNRIFLYTLANYLTAFDRLEFYYYHKHNLTQYAEMLLGSVNAMALDRGSLIENAVGSYGYMGICSTYGGLYQDIYESIDYKR
jgi:hypothetical protein